MIDDRIYCEWSEQVWHAWELAGHYERGCDAPDLWVNGATCRSCDQEIRIPTLVYVNGEDVNGAVATPSANAIARAVRRAFPDAWWVVASRGWLEITGKDGTRAWRLKGESILSLAAALRGDRIRTFSFILPAEPDSFAPRRSRPEAATEEAA